MEALAYKVRVLLDAEDAHSSGAAAAAAAPAVAGPPAGAEPGVPAVPRAVAPISDGVAEEENASATAADVLEDAYR